MVIKVVIFDAYGTLFDVAAAAREAAGEPGYAKLAEAWPQLAFDWRRKQLEYSWLRAITGDHKDFWAVTGDGLDWALEASGLAGDTALRDRLMALYRRLSAYREVPDVLAALKARGLATAILSNGTPEMLEEAVGSAGIGAALDDVLSVETVGIYKPAARVYELVTTRFSCLPGEVLFVSSNGWDIAGATGFGFQTAWVNRAGDPVDRMDQTPGHIIPDLTAIPDIAGAAS